MLKGCTENMNLKMPVEINGDNLVFNCGKAKPSGIPQKIKKREKAL